jgi:putative membrane protein
MKYSISLSRSLAIAAVAVAAIAVRADDSESAKSSQSSEAAQGASASSESGRATDKQSVIKNAAKMNLATQKFSDLAQQKAQSQELKQFAQTLKQDHQKAQQDLERIAQKHNVTLPTSVDEKCQQEISRLEALSGQEFDKEFAKGAVEGHAMAIAHLQQASTSVQDQDLKQYTQQMLSKVKEHQRKGRQIAQSVGIDQTTITSLESKAQDSVGGAASSASGTSRESSSNSSSDSPSKSNSDSSSSSSDPEKKSIE